MRSLFVLLSAIARAMDLVSREYFFLPLANPSSFAFLICIILPSLFARDLRKKSTTAHSLVRV